MQGLLLAKANSEAFAFDPITRFPTQGDLMTWCQEMGPGTGILVALLGIVFLLWGWSMYKALITLNAAIVGGYIGALSGQKFGSLLIGGILGALAAAALTYPLMKWAVAVLGGICGAVVGAGIWRMAGQDPTLAWAGAMTGLVGFGMFSFILFRGSIIMYTSLQGAMMLIAGLLGLAFKYQEIAPQVLSGLTGQPMMLPVAVIIPTILGLIYQQTHSGGGGGGGGGGKPAEKK